MPILVKHTPLGRRAHPLSAEEAQKIEGKVGYVKHNSNLYEELPGTVKPAKKESKKSDSKDKDKDDTEYQTKDMAAKKRGKKADKE